MTLRHVLDILTGLVVMLSIVAYALASGSLMVAVIGAVACAAAWLVGEQLGESRIMRIMANLLVVGALGYALYRALHRGVRIEDVCVLVVAILVIKLFDRGSARDYAQLLILSVFLALGAALTSNAFLMGLVLIVLLPAIVGAVAVFQLFAARERHTAHVSAAVRERPAMGTSCVRDVTRIIGGCAVGVAMVGVGAFVLLPRGVGADVFGRGLRPSTGATTGFTDRVDLGQGGLISESSAIVMDIALSRPDTREAIGAPGVIQYLRGAVLDEYHDGHWRRSRSLAAMDRRPVMVDAGHRIELPLAPNDPPARALVAQKVTIRRRAAGAGAIFSMGLPLAVRFDRTVALVSNGASRTLEVDAPSGGLHYTVLSLTHGTGERRGPLPLPDPVPPQLEPIARHMLASAGVEGGDNVDPARIARIIETALHRHYSYTLDILAAPPEMDPVVWFLTQARRGHCEYFASAMALLCRSVGVRARIVTGFVAAEYNAQSGHYIVRQSNAHAWVQVEVAPGRWTRFDPTPPADLSRVHRPPSGVWGGIQRWFDTLEYAWINAVVTYHRRTPVRIAGQGDGARSRIIAALRTGGAALWVTALAGGVMVFAACAIVLTLVHLCVRRRAVSASLRPGRFGAPTRDAALDAQMRVYADLLRAMSKCGFAKPDTTPPMAHVRSLAAVNARAAAGAKRVVDLFYAVRFGRRPLTAREMIEAREAVGAFQSAMRHTGS